MDTREYALIIVGELRDTLAQADPQACERLADGILAAGKILVAGAGRSGFAAKAFAMRLMHLGFDAYVVGETITPNLTARDLLLVCSGSGETGSLVVMSRKAREIGARLATVTVRREGAVGRMADIVVTLPALTPKADAGNACHSIQPMGSLFEQSLFMLLDAVVLRLMEKRGDDSGHMYTRHANLE